MKKWFVFVLAAVLCGVCSGCGKALSPAVPQQAAETAFAAFLAGDRQVLKAHQEEIWWIPEFHVQPEQYEYACLDLDKDGTAELIVQTVGGPAGYHGVFHWEEGALVCWNSDAAEGSCRDHLLADGTIARQYDVDGASSYTVFRYQSDGERQILSQLYRREEPGTSESAKPCPYYEADGAPVSKAEFDALLEAQITIKLLDPLGWTPLAEEAEK